MITIILLFRQLFKMLVDGNYLLILLHKKKRGEATT